MQVNPEPLKIVATRTGSGGAEKPYIFCRQEKRGRLVRASIHLDGCPKAPADGKRVTAGTWSVSACGYQDMMRAFEQASDEGVEAVVECSCGGWRAL